MDFDIAVETIDILEITGKDTLHCSVLFFLECSVILPVKRNFFTKESILTENQPLRDKNRQLERTLMHLNFLLNEDQGIRLYGG